MTSTADERLRRHLLTWLGRWPGETPLDVVGSPSREHPSWDGRIFTVLGVFTPGSGVLSVPPPAVATVQSTVDDGTTWEGLLPRLPALLGHPDRPVYAGVFRWCERPADLPDVGVWIDAADPWVPDWLRPFGHEVLVARDAETGGYLAGVGIKHHDPYGREIAVGTTERARGRGLARALVAQAARRILDENAVPTYQHEADNVASARVAEASGFPDRGWRSAGMP